MMKFLYNDEHIFIIDKPDHMPAVSLSENEGNTLAALILERHPSQSEVGDDPLEAGLVNRIDNDTSGIIVGAWTREAYEILREAFRSGSVHKEYRALVLGRVDRDGMIDTPIAHHPSKKKKMVVCETEDRSFELRGRPAYTEFTIENRYENDKGEYTLLKVIIETGVRHQIRAHLASIGHPIAGDVLYQNPKKRAEDGLEIRRQFLHSYRIKFEHPILKTNFDITCPLPDDLQSALSQLDPIR